MAPNSSAQNRLAHQGRAQRDVVELDLASESFSNASRPATGQRRNWLRLTWPTWDWREKQSRSTLALLVSCILHTCLLIGLACWYVASQPAVDSLVLQAEVAGAEEVSLGFADLPVLEPPESELSENPSPPPTPELDLNIQSQLAEAPNQVGAALTSAVVAPEKSPGSTGGIGGQGQTKTRGESPSKSGAQFFGSYALGEKFVFVLDSSRSMLGDRWMYACHELMDSVGRLKPNQQFFVICFDEGPSCMFNTPVTRIKYYQNDEDTRTRLKRWLMLRKLGRNTRPASAMTLALNMHPDAIFLLSDGEIRDDTLSLLRQLNGFSTERRQVPVHTIHLMSLEGRATLQAIATENSGSFTPVQGGGT